MCKLVVLFLLSSILSCTAKKVERHCQGLFAHENIVAGTERQLQTIPGLPSSRIVIECLSVLVEYTLESQKRSDICRNEDLSSSHSLHLRAQQAHNSATLNQWPLHFAVGGSLERATYNIPNEGVFSLYFENRHPHNCSLQVSLSLEYTLLQESVLERSEPEPALINIQPNTLYSGSEALFTFQLDALETVSKDDNVIAVPLSASCFESTDASKKIFERVDSNHPIETVWKHVFALTGPYRICYQRGVFPFEEAAQIVVYGSNPQYFIIGHSGQLRLHTSHPFFFIGTNLNPEHDEMKVVLDDNSCTDGSSTTLIARDVQSSEMYALGTASVFNVTFVEAGRYRLCYKHFGSVSSEWVEVPDFDDMPDNVPRPILSEEKTPVGVHSSTSSGTSYRSKPECMMPNLMTDEMFYNFSFSFRFARKSLPPLFADQLAKTLCVPKESITITEIRKSSDSDVDIIWFVDCLDYDEKICERAERMTYAFDVFTKNVNNIAREMKVLQINAVKSGFSIGDSEKHLLKKLDDGYNKFIIIPCLILGFALVAVLSFLAYLSYMGRHGYASPMQAIRNLTSNVGEDVVSMNVTV